MSVSIDHYASTYQYFVETHASTTRLAAKIARWGAWADSITEETNLTRSCMYIYWYFPI